MSCEILKEGEMKLGEAPNISCAFGATAYLAWARAGLRSSGEVNQMEGLVRLNVLRISKWSPLVTHVRRRRMRGEPDR